MKQFAINYGLNVLISLIILSVAAFFFGQVKQLYYAYAPIETFYEPVSMFAPDVCFGDTTQNVTAVRYVKATDTGYAADVVRELFVIDNGFETKVFEQTASPFVEVRPDGTVVRQQTLPELDLGQYRWVLYATVNVNGVLRNDAPPLKSNIFQVKLCS